MRGTRILVPILLLGCLMGGCNRRPYGAPAPSSSLQQEEEDVLFLTPPTPTPYVTISQTPGMPGGPAGSPAPTPAAYTAEDLPEKQAHILKSGVNMRSGPHTEFAVLAVLKEHAALVVTGKSGDWYRVMYQDTEGFVSTEFIQYGPAPAPRPTPKPYTVKRLPGKAAFIDAKEANFRAGPGTDHVILSTGLRYAKVTITGESGNWYRVRYNSKTGYILKRYVRIGVSPGGYKAAGKYTPADVLLLAQIAYRESAKGSSEGYKAVASVVLNRVRSGKYPNSIEKVVFQGNGGQFSPARNAEKLRLTVPSKACVKAVMEVIEKGSILPKNVMYFRSARKGKDWASSREYYGTYGGNCFYT